MRSQVGIGSRSGQLHILAVIADRYCRFFRSESATSAEDRTRRWIDIRRPVQNIYRALGWAGSDLNCATAIRRELKSKVDDVRCGRGIRSQPGANDLSGEFAIWVIPQTANPRCYNVACEFFARFCRRPHNLWRIVFPFSDRPTNRGQNLRLARSD